MFFKKAQLKNVPLIYIDRRAKFSRVAFLMDTCDYILSRDAQDKINHIMKDLIKDYQKSNSRIYYGLENKGVLISTHPLGGHIANIRVSDSTKISKIIYDIVMDNSNWIKRDIFKDSNKPGTI